MQTIAKLKNEVSLTLLQFITLKERRDRTGVAIVNMNMKPVSILHALPDENR